MTLLKVSEKLPLHTTLCNILDGHRWRCCSWLQKVQQVIRRYRGQDAIEPNLLNAFFCFRLHVPSRLHPPSSCNRCISVSPFIEKWRIADIELTGREWWEMKMALVINMTWIVALFVQLLAGFAISGSWGVGHKSNSNDIHCLGVGPEHICCCQSLLYAVTVLRAVAKSCNSFSDIWNCNAKTEH